MFFYSNLPSTSAAADALEFKSRQLEKNLKEKLHLEISNNYKKYRSQPESHPLYQKEWKAFWSNRYRELRREGRVDPDTFDYKAEWVAFFTARLDILEKDELQEAEKRLKEKHGTPKRSIVSSSSSSEDDHCDDRDFGSTKRFKSSDYYSRSSHQAFSHQSASKVASSQEKGNESVTVKSVCSLLLSLESDLGLLAERVLQLMSSAITIEHTNPHSSDEVILNDSENVVLLLTVRQKLKGLAILNLLEAKKMVIVKKSIQNIAILVHQANLKLQENERMAELATGISKALVVSGNDNCTPEQLEALTSEFIQPSRVEQKKISLNPTKRAEEASSIDALSVDEFKILLDNFEELTDTEQSQIMVFLKNLETNDPTKAEIFKKFMISRNSGQFRMIHDGDFSFDYKVREI